MRDRASAALTLPLQVNFAINIVLLVSKGFAVLSSTSISLVASFIDSGLDFLSTLIILGTSIAMGRQSDRHKYPAGKKRFEPLGVLIFAVAMIASFAQVSRAIGQDRVRLIEYPSQVFIESFQRAIGKQEEEVAELSWIGMAYVTRYPPQGKPKSHRSNLQYDGCYNRNQGNRLGLVRSDSVDCGQSPRPRCRK